METVEKIRKLQTLPWYALHDIAIQNGVEQKEVNGKDKEVIIEKILSNGILTEEEIEQYVNDYIYGDRITFTLWTFQESLKDGDFEEILALVNTEDEYLPISGYRKMKILSVNDYENRVEILYVYSKEYSYVNEEGKNDGVWEQHRGCLWVGKKATYLACMSKHEKMTTFITHFISDTLSNPITQINPPKSAIDKCTNFKAISRIVLQGQAGEKTIVSRAGGITDKQEEEIGRIRAERIDTSGSFIAEITDDIDATIKYNVRKGSVGIYRHLPAPVLFEWSEKAIETIFEEIENLKGKPAEEIYKETGQEIKWTGISTAEYPQLNWYLTQVISALGQENYEVQIPQDKLAVLQNNKLFRKFIRIYCNSCDSYEIPYCTNCGAELQIIKGKIQPCGCGAPTRIQCSEGHNCCDIVPWFIGTESLKRMIDKNIRKIFKDSTLNYNIFIVDDKLNIINGIDNIQTEVEVPFEEIECFKHDTITLSDRLKAYAVNMNEKCKSGGCSNKKINECIKNKDMVCLPKLFYSILPNYRPQPHKGTEYGDVSSQVRIGNKSYELLGIIKKNSKNNSRGNKTVDDKIASPLLSTSAEGQEIIRQFIEQGMSDNRCEIIAVIVPQYIDAGLKGTLRYLAKLSGKKVTFIELDEVCELISMNENIRVS